MPEDIPSREVFINTLRDHGAQVRCRACGSHDIEIVEVPSTPQPDQPPLQPGEHRGHEFVPFPDVEVGEEEEAEADVEAESSSTEPEEAAAS